MITMSKQAQESTSSTVAADGVLSKDAAAPTSLSTQPGPNQSWQITLAGKFIASMSDR